MKLYRHFCQIPILTIFSFFNIGRTCFKADLLNKHERTDEHKSAMLRCNEDSAAAADNFHKAIISAKAKSEEAVISAMKIIFFQAKECIATIKFTPLMDLCKDLGSTSLQHLKSADNASYDSYGSIREMEEAICKVIKSELKEKIRCSRWYSVLLDESTDVSTTQSVIVYLRLLDKGVVSSHFLKLQALSGCTSDEIFGAALEALEEFDIKFQNISGLGTDGARNMTGCKKGVATLFKSQSKQIIGIHCSAHRLALASGQAANSVLYLVKFQDILNRIFKYFHYSPKNTAFLKEVQDMLDVPEKKFVQTFSTRWLSFYKSVSIVLDHWSDLVSVLMNDQSAIAQGLLKSITNYKFLATSAYLCDVLFVLNDLCYTFVESRADFNTVNLKLDCCIAELKEISENETGTRFMEFRSKVPECTEGNGFDYEGGHFVKDNDKLRSESIFVRKSFMSSLLNNLAERFEDIPYVKMFEFLLPCNMPNETDEKFSAYGVKEIKKLCAFFADDTILGCEKEMLHEWKLFRRVLSTRCKNMNLADCMMFFHKNEIANMFPKVTSLYEFVATLPLSTADCERGFSLMNIVKTDLRNRLSIKHLSNLMLINLEGGVSNQFAFKQAFNEWCVAKPRRISLIE